MRAIQARPVETIARRSGSARVGGLFKNAREHVILGSTGDQGPTTIRGAELVKPGATYYALQSFALATTLNEIIVDGAICKNAGGGGAGGINLAASGGGTYVGSYATNCKSDFDVNNVDASVDQGGNLPAANF